MDNDEPSPALPTTWALVFTALLVLTPLALALLRDHGLKSQQRSGFTSTPG